MAAAWRWLSAPKVVFASSFSSGADDADASASTSFIEGTCGSASSIKGCILELDENRRNFTERNALMRATVRSKAKGRKDLVPDDPL